MARKRVAVLISGRGSNMTALIDAAKASDYPAEIVIVISNRPDAPGLASAQSAGIKAVAIEHETFGADRGSFERVVERELASRNIDLICLAGFMRLLTPEFVQRWQGRLINIHPALLPSFKGLHTHAAALKSGVRIHGATVHFVIAEVDAGPIICQGAVPVNEGDTAETLAARVLRVEHRLYPMALRWIAEGRVRVVDGRCHIDGLVAGDGSLLAPHEGQ